MKSQLNRRHFLKRSAAAGGAWLALPYLSFGKISPNEKLNIGVIGTHNRAAEDVRGVQGENIVAICDIDQKLLDAAQQKFPAAKQYLDFRKMLEQKNIDAVVVGTPDHNHAVITVAALRSGRHVYCEKPLTHTISEVRIVAETTRKTGLVTQMGNQIHATDHYRRVVEMVKSGAIGPVHEVHCWVGSKWGSTEVPPAEPVPAGLDYEQWLGPVPYRPYSHEYVPVHWRAYWAFGGGTIADFCCHLTDLAFWALDIKSPLTIEAEGPPVHPECAPEWLIVRYEYAARGSQPPLKLVWYSGDRRPPYELPKKTELPSPGRRFDNLGREHRWGNGVLFVGAKGMLLTDYEASVLLPEKDFAGFVPPPQTIPNSIGHHAEWIHAIKTNGPTTCNFKYGAMLTEAGLLGNVAFRTGKKIEWDAENMRAKNCPEAEEFIHHKYRAGWSI